MATATRTELAKFLGITVRHVDRLVTEGVLPGADDGEFDVGESVLAYCNRLRHDEATKEARRDLLRQQTIDRRLKTRAVLGKTATEAELHDFITQTHLSFLEGWRFVASSFYRRLIGVLGEEEARVAAGGLESEAVGWLGDARDHMVPKLEHLLRNLADDGRIAELMARLDSEVSAEQRRLARGN